MTKVHVNVARSEEEISAAFDIREKVYIDEQQIDRDDEFDQFEDISRHFVAYADGNACGAARWRFTQEGAKLERFAVLPEYRRLGVGAALVAAVIDDVQSRPEYEGQLLYLNAQESAMPLYTKFNFTPVGDPFFECDIKHFRMELPA
jgi:predicted GNAT family N-acyltransferase